MTNMQVFFGMVGMIVFAMVVGVLHIAWGADIKKLGKLVWGAIKDVFHYVRWMGLLIPPAPPPERRRYDWDITNEELGELEEPERMITSAVGEATRAAMRRVNDEIDEIVGIDPAAPDEGSSAVPQIIVHSTPTIMEGLRGRADSPQAFEQEIRRLVGQYLMESMEHMAVDLSVLGEDVASHLQSIESSTITERDVIRVTNELLGRQGEPPIPESEHPAPPPPPPARTSSAGGFVTAAEAFRSLGQAAAGAFAGVNVQAVTTGRTSMASGGVVASGENGMVRGSTNMTSEQLDTLVSLEHDNIERNMLERTVRIGDRVFRLEDLMDAGARERSTEVATVTNLRDAAIRFTMSGWQSENGDDRTSTGAGEAMAQRADRREQRLQAQIEVVYHGRMTNQVTNEGTVIKIQGLGLGFSTTLLEDHGASPTSEPSIRDAIIRVMAAQGTIPESMARQAIKDHYSERRGMQKEAEAEELNQPLRGHKHALRRFTAKRKH